MSEKPFLFHLNHFFRSEVIEVLRYINFPGIVTYRDLANFQKTHLSLEVTQHNISFILKREIITFLMFLCYYVYKFLCKQPTMLVL